ncbi:MAG: type VI immunity family protein, partial [Gammaproteobacteria bacterium]
EHLTWLWREEPPTGPNLQSYSDAPAITSMMKKLDADDLVSFAYVGGKKPEDASPWQFYVQGVRAWRAQMASGGLGALAFSFPALFVEENPTAFQDLFVKFSRLLRVVHGHAGFAFNLSLPREEQNEATEAFMTTLMNGIDAGNAAVIGGRGKSGIREHIKSVGWLTAVNHALLDKVGGLFALHSELPADWFAKYDYGDGIVVQAGPKPEIADVNIDPLPALFVLPNMAFKEVRIEKIETLHYPSQHGEPRLVGWAAEQWIRRFDVPDDQVMSFKSKLLHEPKLTRTTTLPDHL